MPRPKRIRRIIHPPLYKGFKPIGGNENVNPVIMNYEEYEAIRLSDYELFSQVYSAFEMGVSRPTFARIYESARRKVALAFKEGRPIIFEGGKIYFDSQWFSCNECGCWFNHINRETDLKKCALCGSDNIQPYNENDTLEEEICICQQCGYQSKHQKEIPCHYSFCPDCGHRMIRRRITFAGKI